MTRWLIAVDRARKADHEKIVEMWNAGRTVAEIQAVVPISTRAIQETIEAQNSRQAAGR
jgi:uncharacterized protein (DUF433 family)